MKTYSYTEIAKYLSLSKMIEVDETPDGFVAEYFVHYDPIEQELLEWETEDTVTFSCRAKYAELLAESMVLGKRTGDPDRDLSDAFWKEIFLLEDLANPSFLKISIDLASQLNRYLEKNPG